MHDYKFQAFENPQNFLVNDPIVQGAKNKVNSLKFKKMDQIRQKDYK